MNPYKILGVKKSASVEEIRDAWKELVKQHHPDKGGDEEKFKEVQAAYAILIDPAQRKQYDETGFVAGDPKSQVKQRAMQNLMNMFSQLLDQVPEHEIERVDVVKIMRDASQNALIENNNTISKLLHQQNKIERSLEKLRKRIKQKKRGEMNFMVIAAERKLEGIKAQQLQPKQVIEVIEASLKILENFEYEFEPMEMMTCDNRVEALSPEQARAQAEQMQLLMRRVFRF